MARSVLDIVIRTVKEGGGDKQTVSALVDLKSGLASATAAFAAIAGAAYAFDKALDATVGKAVEYSNKVEAISNATGMSAESSSRTIQVLDDLRVSYEDLSASVKKNADVTNFSISGLAALSAEYQNLSTQTEKQAFAQAHFGKQWVEFIKVLDAGPEKLQQMSQAIDQNLIATEKSQQAARKYQENIDNLTDAWDGFMIAAGNEVIPALNTLLESIVENQEAISWWIDTLTYLAPIRLLIGALKEEESGHVSAMQAVHDHNEAMKEAADATSDLGQNYKELIDITFGLQAGYDDFAKKNEEVKQKMDAVNAAFAEGKISAEEQTTQMAELNGELQQNSAEMDKWAKKYILSLVQARLATDGFTSDETGFLISLAESFGLVDEATATMAQKVNSSLDNIDLSNPEALHSILTDITALPHNQTFNIQTNYTSTGTPPATVGGGYVPPGKPAPVEKAIGGQYAAGDPLHVHQDEYLVPQTGGYVLTRTDAAKILQDSVGGGGGGGRNVTIYGGVTVIAQGGIMDAIEEIG